MQAAQAAVTAPDRRAASARAAAMMARPAGSPSVRANCAATAVRCPASAAAIWAGEAVSLGLGAGTDSPAIQDSVKAIPVRPIALYCGGGVSAAEAFLALHTAGIQTARVYDGSWTEWGADPATPKAPHGNG